MKKRTSSKSFKNSTVSQLKSILFFLKSPAFIRFAQEFPQTAVFSKLSLKSVKFREYMKKFSVLETNQGPFQPVLQLLVASNYLQPNVWQELLASSFL